VVLLHHWSNRWLSETRYLPETQNLHYNLEWQVFSCQFGKIVFAYVSCKNLNYRIFWKIEQINLDLYIECRKAIESFKARLRIILRTITVCGQLDTLYILSNYTCQIIFLLMLQVRILCKEKFLQSWFLAAIVLMVLRGWRCQIVRKCYSFSFWCHRHYL